MDNDELIFELENSQTEQGLVRLIAKNLMTDEHSAALAPYDLTVYDLLGGRWQYSQACNAMVKAIFEDWNQKLGKVVFGRNCGLGIE